MWTSYTDFLRNWENLEGKRLCHEVIDRLVEFASFSKGEAQKKVLDRIKEVKKAYREFGLLAITTGSPSAFAVVEILPPNILV